MTREEAKARFAKYLKSNLIKFYEDNDGVAAMYRMTYQGYDLCPEHCLESCIWFYPDHMEARVYYSIGGAELCKESKYKPELLRLLNYINAEVWPIALDRKGGTLYKPRVLYAPRIYMTEDEICDITLTFPVSYDFYEAAPLETEDFITASCPDLMNVLAFAIFGLIVESINLEQAMAYVRSSLSVGDM